MGSSLTWESICYLGLSWISVGPSLIYTAGCSDLMVNMLTVLETSRLTNLYVCITSSQSAVCLKGQKILATHPPTWNLHKPSLTISIGLLSKFRTGGSCLVCSRSTPPQWQLFHNVHISPLQLVSVMCWCTLAINKCTLDTVAVLLQVWWLKHSQDGCKMCQKQDLLSCGSCTAVSVEMF